MGSNERAQRLDTAVRREQIAAAALKLAEKGLKAITVGAVAKAVGLAPSALYRHFENRDAILQAAFSVPRGRLQENLRLSQAEPRAMDGLHGFLQRQLGIIRAYPAIPRLLFSDDVCAEDSPLRGVIVAAQDAMLDGIAGIVAEGQARGDIRDDADARDLALLFLGQLLIPAYMDFLRRGGFDLENRVARNWAIFQRFLAAPAAGGQGPCAAR